MLIYKTTNQVNGKIYVGQTKMDNPEYLGSGTILAMAIQKYGRENFVRETLQTCSSQDELDEREKFWIKELDCTNPEIGYNIRPGGSGLGAVDILDIWERKYGKEKANEMWSDRYANMPKGKDSARWIGIDEKEAIRLYTEENLALTKIGKRFGVSKNKIKRVLDNNGIKTRSRSESAAIRPKISEETKKKMSDAKKGTNNHMYGKSVYDVWSEKLSPEEVKERMKEYKQTMSESLKKSGFNKGDKHYSRKNKNTTR